MSFKIGDYQFANQKLFGPGLPKEGLVCGKSTDESVDECAKELLVSQGGSCPLPARGRVEHEFSRARSAGYEKVEAVAQRVVYPSSDEEEKKWLGAPAEDLGALLVFREEKGEGPCSLFEGGEKNVLEDVPPVGVEGLVFASDGKEDDACSLGSPDEGSPWVESPSSPPWIPEEGAGNYDKKDLCHLCEKYIGKPDGLYRYSVDGFPVTVLVQKGHSFLLLTHTEWFGHEVVGKGADKCVKKAIDLATGEEVAVSVVREKPSSHPQHQPKSSTTKKWDENEGAWKQEVAYQEQAAGVSPRVLPVFASYLESDAEAVGEARRKAYIVTPLVEADLFHYDVPAGEREQVGIQIIYDVLKGLKALHEAGTAHMDLHGGNIFIKEKRAFIADFSRAKPLTAANKLADFYRLYYQVLVHQDSYKSKQTLLDLSIPSHQLVRNALYNLAEGTYTAAQVLTDMKAKFSWLQED